MRAFLETVFRPRELEVIDGAFSDWLTRHRVPRGDPDAELAAAIIITLYREGHRSRPALEASMAKHRGLIDLGSLASGS